jgi:EAL domain-containing protein (putative c-di-GMP-specific phosphodiesterase class I)/GGDEF domain-containing protein
MGHSASQASDGQSDPTIAAVDDLVATEALSIVFQPIVDLREVRVAGYEALTRPDPSSGFSGPMELFDAAERHGRLEEVEAIARRQALDAITSGPGFGLLFLNNSPFVFSNAAFLDQICSELESAAPVTPHDVVLEITERTHHRMHDKLTARSLELRERGFHVAMDDVGAGVSGLNRIMTIRPNWIKLDRELTSRIDVDPLKQNLIRFFVHFAKLGNMELIAEGIERVEELRVLIELGVCYGQGFLLGRPGPLGAELTPEVEQQIRAARDRCAVRRCFDASSVRVGSLAQPTLTCDITDTVPAVLDRVRNSPHSQGIVILNGRRYVGWLDEEQLESTCMPESSVRTIGTLPIHNASLVGHNTSLAEGLDIAAAMPEGELTLPLVVQEEGAIAGIVSLRRLLQAGAGAHRRAPSHVAPLTGLPGRVQADEWVAAHIRTRDAVDIAMIDLRDFDAYNRAYGFEKGDEMLVGLIELIHARLVDVEGGAEFCAHLGEDRFMLAFSRPAAERLQQLVMDFEAEHGRFFSSVELEGGTYRSRGPAGHFKKHPLTMLRVIYLPQILLDIDEPHELHFIARRLSLRSFDTKGDMRHIITDRRGGPRASMARAS